MKENYIQIKTWRKNKMKDKNEVLKGLGQFSGTEQYYKDYLGLLLTDGTKYLMEELKCGWLMSDIAVIVKMKLKKEEFICVKLFVKDSKAKVVYDDGNGNVLFQQKYEYTDFPEVEEFKMFYTNGVLMLTSEY